MDECFVAIDVWDLDYSKFVFDLGLLCRQVFSEGTMLFQRESWYRGFGDGQCAVFIIGLARDKLEAILIAGSLTVGVVIPVSDVLFSDGNQVILDLLSWRDCLDHFCYEGTILSI